MIKKAPKQLERDEESLHFRETLKQACLEGYSNLIWITGPSGVGKTLLVESVEQYFKNNGYWFISTKFDRYDQTPYKTINEVYQKIVLKCKTDLSLHEDEDKIKWRASIQKGENLIEFLSRESRGVNTNALTNSQKQKDLIERAIRLFYVKLEKHITRIIIFLDDIQWADDGSLEVIKILKRLILQQKVKKVSLIGTYRTKGANLSGNNLLATLTYGDYPQQRVIQLKNFSLVRIINIIRIRYDWAEEETIRLSRICYEKTNGNPFHLFSFLVAAEKKQYLIQKGKESKGYCDFSAIVELPATQNVVGLLKEQLLNLPVPFQLSLSLAAAVGDKVNLELYDQIAKGGSTFKKEYLEVALQKGFLTSNFDSTTDLASKKSFWFAHDEIRSACYKLYPVKARPNLHLRIAEAMEVYYQKNPQKTSFFQLAKHYFLSEKAINQPADWQKVIHYNFQAALTAREVLAYHTALDYLKKGYELLKQKGVSWYANEWTWSFAKTLVKTSFFCGEYHAINRLLKDLEHEQIPFNERLPLYELQIRCLLTHMQYEEATKKCLFLLRSQYNTIIPLQEKQTKKRKFIWEFYKTAILTRNISIKRFRLLRRSENKGDLGLMSLLTLTALAIYNVDVDGFFFTICKCIQVTIKKGYSKYAPPFYAAYGLILCQWPLPLLKKGVAIADLSEEYLKGTEEVANPFDAAYVIYGLVKFWGYPLRDTLKVGCSICWFQHTSTFSGKICRTFSAWKIGALVHLGLRPRLSYISPSG